MHDGRCSLITQPVVTGRPKFLTCLGIIAIKCIPSEVNQSANHSPKSACRSPFPCPQPSFLQSCLPVRAWVQKTKSLSCSRTQTIPSSATSLSMRAGKPFTGTRFPNIIYRFRHQWHTKKPYILGQTRYHHQWQWNF